MKDEKKQDRSGEAFTDQQQAADKAINEQIKSEQQRDKIDPADADKKRHRQYQTDVPRKKTGPVKQRGPGM
jgi:hypothetical protein